MGLRKKETLMTNYMALGEYTAYSEQARGVEFYSLKLDPTG